MTLPIRAGRCLGILALVTMLGHATESEAQTAGDVPSVRQPLIPQPPTPSPENPPPRTPVSSAGWKSLFAQTVHDIGQLPTSDTARLLTLGAIFAATAHPVDNDISRSLSSAKELRSSVRPGAVLGSTPFQVASAVVVYGIGRVTDRPRIAHVGGDLIRAQLLAEGMVIGMKQTFRRARPEGSGFSFPSGHTTVSFASATVLHRHFGWRIGLPAYGVAGYVALSRVQMRRHYLSDVAFGAALGIVAGRTITLGHERGMQVTAMAPNGAPGVSFTWIGKKP